VLVTKFSTLLQYLELDIIGGRFLTINWKVEF